MVDVITTEGERSVLKNLQRKAASADAMFTSLVSHMQDAQVVQQLTGAVPEDVPSWL